jgi:hypothetical protein
MSSGAPDGANVDSSRACNTTATLIENPVVADVDNDGHADLPLYSLESESLILPLASAPPGLVFAIVDDTTTPHPE